MSTVRHVGLRWINTEGPPARRNVRALIALAALCPAVFAGFFAIGRATVSTHTSQPTIAPSLSSTNTGASVPTQLGDAPTLRTIAAPRRPHHAASPPAATPAIANPVVQTETPSAPTTVSTPPPAVTPAPTAPAATTAPAHHSQPHSGGGVSFDSSG